MINLKNRALARLALLCLILITHRVHVFGQIGAWAPDGFTVGNGPLTTIVKWDNPTLVVRASSITPFLFSNLLIIPQNPILHPFSV